MTFAGRPTGVERPEGDNYGARMFRTISLVHLTDDADAPDLVAAARRIYAGDPNISRVTVALGRRLLEPQWPQASYSIEMEFETEQHWRDFRQGKAHGEMQQAAAGRVESMLATQYDAPPA